jgi:amino acid transporter
MQKQDISLELPAAAVSPSDKGLKRNAVSFLSNLVIGVSSTAPASSLASALGIIAGAAGFATPAVLIVAFVPMAFVATAYFYLNRADPDCGTTFAWVTRAIGPYTGWIAGWALIVTGIVVMPSLAVISAQYSFDLAGFGQPSALSAGLAGAAWIAAMTAICYLGIELSARTQLVLLSVEIAVLLIFAGAALAKVYLGSAPPGAAAVALNWFDPWKIESADKFTDAFLVAVFVYWGWDAGVSVNEETANPRTAPGFAAVVSTVLLVAIFVVVAAAAVSFAGPALLSANKEDIFAPLGAGVLGPWLSKLLVVAVLTSAVAAAQTTILATSRTALSMAAAGAIPRRFADISRRYRSPSVATLTMGGLSIVWYACLAALSKNVLDDSIRALGLSIAFYYALTALACTVLYRRASLKSVKNFVLMGVIPAAGALSMVFLLAKSCFTLAGTGSSTILGFETPLAIGLGSPLVGFALMILVRVRQPEFFRGGSRTGQAGGRRALAPERSRTKSEEVP